MDGEDIDNQHASDNELDEISDDGSEDEEIASEELDAAKAAKQAAAKASSNQTEHDTVAADGQCASQQRPAKKQRLSETERRKALLVHSTKLPFQTESLDEFDERLEVIIQRLTECIETKDWAVGFAQWNHRLQCLLSLKYPMKQRTQAALARMFYELAVMPNLPRWITSIAAKKFMHLAADRKTFMPRLQLRWKPLFEAIEPFLAPKARAVSLGGGVGAALAASGATDTTKTGTLLRLALHANWYFISEASYQRSLAHDDGKNTHGDTDEPDLVDEMLDAFLPLMDGSDLDSVIRVQSLLVHFLPVSHPQKWLPAMFRLWESFNSSLFTDQMLDLLARLSTYHMTNPKLSSEKRWKFRNGGWIEAVRKSEAKRAEEQAREEAQRAAEATRGQDQTKPTADQQSTSNDLQSVEAADHADDGLGLEDVFDDDSSLIEADNADYDGDAQGKRGDEDNSAGLLRSTANGSSAAQPDEELQGLTQDVGIFTTEQFEHIMTELLRSCGLPVGSDKTGKASTLVSSSMLRTGVDATASRGTLGMKKASDRMVSFATIIAFSLAEDGPVSGVGLSGVPTCGSATPTHHSAQSTSNATPDARPSLPTTLAVPGVSTLPGLQTFLGGSRALDSMARFVQATESFFHPSNWGPWQMRMTSFIYNLSWQVLRRVRNERKKGGKYCRTPKHLRITDTIEIEFVKTLKTVCLLSMFGKDILTTSRSQGTLRNLALMKPDLIVPAVLEGSYSSLEALETTHRTTATITALTALAHPLISRENYPAGAQHLVPLLHLCIPGIDPNDPIKTMSTGMLILMAMSSLRIDDMTRHEQNAQRNGQDVIGVDGMDLDPSASKDDIENDSARAEADEALRLSTSQFDDWVVQFFNSVLRILEALPEEGRTGRSGGKTEERMVATLLVACDVTCQAMSDHTFDIAFNIVFRHCISTISSNSVKHLGGLVACFSRSNGAKVLNKLLPICVERARQELDHGASSTRTTSTSTPLDSDTALHHFLSVLCGALNCDGSLLVAHKDLIVDLLCDLSERCRSERGYGFVARVYAKIFTICTQIYALDGHFVNPSTWNDPKFQREAHLWWGKQYTIKEVEVDWHTPSNAEIDLALQLLEKTVTPLLDKIEMLLAKPGAERDKIWSNDFCRYLTHARAVFESMHSLIKLEEKGGGATVTDMALEVPEFVELPPRFRSGFVLTDPEDERYQTVLRCRERFGDLMLVAARTSRGSAAEDQIDCVKQIIRSIQSYMTSYAYSGTDYKYYASSLRFIRKMSKLHAAQTAFPRRLWVRKFALHQISVARLNSFHRKRTVKDDQLIEQVLDFALSDYVSVRKRAQSLLKTIGSLYDGTRTLCMPKLAESLKPGISDDQMKGALHVLASRGFFRYAFDDDKRLAEYLDGMLAAQYRSKPSIQKLVRSIVNSIVGAFPEVMTLDATAVPADLQRALSQIRVEISKETIKTDERTLDAVRQTARQRLANRDEVFDTLLPRILSIIQAEQTHWAYALFGARLLRALTRKDRPLNKDLVVFAAQTIVHEDPKMRRYAHITFAKNLYYAKLRTLAKSDSDLAQQKGINPHKRTEALPQPLPDDWVASELAAFAEGDLTPSTRLKDKTTSGWLVLPKQQSYYVVPKDESETIKWEAASQHALTAVKAVISNKDWWSKVIAQAGQEKERNYLSVEMMGSIKGIFQIYGIEVLQYVQQEVEKNIAERDRHKHRAAAEVICSVVRASKHWTLADQEKLWAWFISLWPTILKGCSPDSLTVWLMAVEHILFSRDPHRVRALINVITVRAKESIEKGNVDESPWEQAKAQNFLRSVLLSLQTKFTAWAPDFVKIYWDNIGHDFQEVRSILSESLADLDLLGTPPKFASTEAFLQACSQGRGSLLAKSALYEARLEQVALNLRTWRAERVPTAVGTSQYDRASLTTLHWISTTLIDHRNSAIAGQTIRFLPEIFAMLELLDNTELSSMAKKTLNAIAVYPFTADCVSPLIRKLLEVIRSSHGSWRIRLDVLPVLQVTYFRNLFYLSTDIVQEVNDLLLELLEDAHLEVREMASTTLSGIIRCSQRGLIRQLKDRFTHTVKTVKLPKRDAADYQAKLLQLHGGILGVVALLSASPYTVPDWMPELIVDTVAAHTDDPVPISTTVRRCAASWKATHQDTWHEERHKFTEEQLQEVTEWTLGRSDYFV